MVTVRITGLRQLEKNLMKIDTAVNAKTPARNALKKGAEPFVESAIRLAPDDPRTGGRDLKRSISVSTKTTKSVKSFLRSSGFSNRAVWVYAGVEKHIFYGHFVEFGTEDMAAIPFMRPAWDTNKDEVLDRIISELKVQIKKAVARSEKRLAKSFGI